MPALETCSPLRRSTSAQPATARPSLAVTRANRQPGGTRRGRVSLGTSARHAARMASMPASQVSSSRSSTQGGSSLNAAERQVTRRFGRRLHPPSLAAAPALARNEDGYSAPRVAGRERADLGGHEMVERWIADSGLSERYPIYTRANVGEVFPDPVTPLTRDTGIWLAELGLARCVGARWRVRPQRVRPRRDRAARHHRWLLLPQRVVDPTLWGARAWAVCPGDGRAVLRHAARHPAVRRSNRAMSISTRPSASARRSGGR